MSGSKNRKQLVLTLSPDDDDLLRAIHEAKAAALAKEGGTITLSAYVMRLVKAEAEKLGIKPGKPAASKRASQKRSTR